MRRGPCILVLVLVAGGLVAQPPQPSLPGIQERYAAGDFEGALELGRRFVESAPAGPERAQALNYLGAICYQLGRFEEAVGHLREALAGLDAASVEHVSAQNDLGECLRAAGDFEAARSTLGQALQRVRELAPDSQLHAQILNNVAGLARDEGDFARTEQLLRDALRITEGLADASGDRIATAQLNLAELLRMQSRYAEARGPYQRALALARTTFPEDHPYLVYFLNQYALLCTEEGRFAAADSLRSEALAVLEGQADSYPVLLAMLLDDRAGDRLARGEARLAVSDLSRALSLREANYAEDHWEIGVTLARLARAEFETGQTAREVESRASRAVAILERSTVAPEDRADALAVRALARRGMGQDGRALQDLAQAVELVEQLRVRRGGGDEARARLLARHAAYYDELIDLRLRAGHAAEAFEAIERFRARALRERLQLDPQRLLASVDPARRAELLRGLALAQAQLVKLQDERTLSAYAADAGDPQERERLSDDFRQRLEAAVRDYQAAQEALRQASPAWRALLHDRGSATLEQFQRELRTREAALVYWVGPAHAWLLEIGPKGGPRTFELRIDDRSARALALPAGKLTLDLLAALEGVGESGRSFFERQRGIGSVTTLPDPDQPMQSPELRSHALWRVLLPADVWKRVRRADELTILPSGPLHALPFEALVVGDPREGELRYWLDDGPPLRYADSASTLLQIARRRSARREYPQQDILSVSDPVLDDFRESSWGELPPLPGTLEESRQLQELFGPARVQWLHGREATESAVRAASSGMRYLHLATHGVVDDRTSDVLAGLALTREGDEAAVDGRLQLYEIDALSLEAELAVLSACRTAAGKRVESEGVYALSRGFHVAGSLRVVASLWSVSDASTAQLVGELFRSIAQAEAAREPVSYARALRDAKRAVRSQERWADPFYWAPFLLSGVH